MVLQDILGQLPLLKSYTHILLCFSLPDSQREPVVDSLQCATKRLLAAFPFLAGKVVHKDIAPGHSGTFTVEDFDNGNCTDKVQQIFYIKDLSDVLPPYATVYAAHAPPAMLPASIVAPPRPAFPRVYTEESAPVLEIQATLVHGGLLLNLAAQHNIIDATGMFYIAHLLARLMDDKPSPISQSELLLGNCDRRNLIPLLPQDEPLPDEMSFFTQPYPPRLDPETLSQFNWHLLHFSPQSIASIHAEANSHPEDFVPPITSVSVNDAITAFCWQRLSLVRAQSLPTTHTENPNEQSTPTTQLTRAADLRRPMSLSHAYMGHMVRTASLRLSLHTVTTTTLSHLSSALRQTIKTHTTPKSISTYATLLSRTPDKSTILYAGGFNPLLDFSCSSVAHLTLPVFGGGLGNRKPDFVRRPTAGVLPGGMYVGPGRGGVGADAMVCLRGGEVEGLRGDEVWMGRVEFIG
ncbi:hypothetical protein BDW59DRAFT_163232 [Aspergillus cavernicola]|uniref:Trichothecene 3-O-acetyltransferase-like N-terminal domain-containing protein n=1 Tax=Aspergillus cavernicola TaxID=176166 RepID=A0ABR4I901_9EURO